MAASDIKRPDRVLSDHPTERPLERFWPYAELSEQPSDDELARLNPGLRHTLFGTPGPFSISIVFPAFDGPNYGTALTRAKAADEYFESVEGGKPRHWARFLPADRPLRIRDLWEIVGSVPGVEVLVDDRAVPYARELWLPLVFLLIS